MQATDRHSRETRGSHPDRPLADLVTPGTFVTLITADTDGVQRGRPVTVQEVDRGVLRFLVSRSTEWAETLPLGADSASADSPSLVVISEPQDNRFATLGGDASLNPDRSLVERLWSPAAKVFFEGPDDPDAVALEFRMTHGQWWDGPSSKLGNVVALVRAAVTGNPDDAGDAGDVTAG